MSDGIQLKVFHKSDRDHPYENHTINVTSRSPGSSPEYDNSGYEAEESNMFTIRSSGYVSPEPHQEEPDQLYTTISEEANYNSHTVKLGTQEEHQEEVSDDEGQPGACLSKVQAGQKALKEFFNQHGATVKTVLGCVVLVAYAVYFGYAMSRGLENEDQIRLLWITCLAIFLCCVSLFNQTCGPSFGEKVLSPIVNFIWLNFKFFKWAFIAAFILFVVVFIAVDIVQYHPRNLVSLIGYALYVLLLFVFSTNPSKVRWRPVCWGLGIQFVFALLILRTSFGFEAFKWLGDRMSEFLVHTDEGSKFVFGDSYEDHMFAFKVLPVVIFFSTAISILYYLGVMQIVILRLAWVMQLTLGTTAPESVNAAGNIFIGQTEAPLLIKPFINDMTASELHAVMTGGFATIAGSVMASYIVFGVAANHLITASVMAAPAALAMSKLSCPEIDKPKSDAKGFSMEKPPQQNIIEAASSGASAAIGLVANIAANLLAFMALLAFVNATLEWFGARVGLVPPEYPALTFQLICSYVMWPFAFVMGVDVTDCQKVAELIGIKTFINEMVAYSKLGELIENRKILDIYVGDWSWVNGNILLEGTGQILDGGVISARSTIISTYALCGFANLSSIGIVIGGLGAMSEKQRPVLARLALRAMITGNIVCFMNACTAGLLYKDT